MKITTVNNKNIKATIAFFITVLLIVFIAFIFKYNFASAGAGESVRGFAWGGTESLGGYQGFGWISLNSITDGSPVSYGVNVPAGDGNLSGHAWSEHYGWISFNGADLAGCLPVLTQAKITGANVTGGARITAIRDAGGNAGGFDGCISLSGSSYGVTAASGGAYTLLQGFAWSSDLGWIDFNVSGSPVPVNLPSPTVFTATPGACDSSVINLSWNPVAGATSYILKDNGINLPLAPITATTFSHTGLTAGSSHPYTVMASDGVSNSANVAISAVAPLACGLPPPSGNITASPCTILVGGSSCISNVSWNSSNFAGALVEQNGSFLSNSFSDSVPVSVNPDNDDFTLDDTGSGFTATANANATCVASIWDGSTCVLAVVSPPAASIALKALPSLVRSGNTTIVEVTINSANPTTCELYGVDNSPKTIIHPGTALNPIGTYTPYITKALTGAQIVTINCTIDGAIPAVDSSDIMRINVVPTIQEI